MPCNCCKKTDVVLYTDHTALVNISSVMKTDFNSISLIEITLVIVYFLACHYGERKSSEKRNMHKRL